MGRMGTSSSFVLRTPRRSIKKQAAKAATRSVVLIGSHFGAGNDLLKSVFGELCQRSRLSLRCEATWGGTHDLKSLANFKGRNKRLVWLESDAESLLRTMRNLRGHALTYHMVHLLWDPMQACAAQWALTLPSAGNVSLDAACHGLRMSALPALYKRAKRDRAHVLQLRMEDLVTKKNGLGSATWRQLFRFLELAQEKGDLTAVGTRAVAELELRSRVRNTAAPGWVREAITRNATLHTYLKKLRRELEYNKPKGGGSGTVTASGGAAATGGGGVSGRQLDASNQ